MYSAFSAIGVRFGVGKRWETINLATVPVKDLVTTYRRFQLELTLPTLVPHMYLDGEVVRRNWPNETGTVQQLLASLGNASLPTTETGIKLNLRTAQYKDGFKAGYTVTPVTHANNDNPSIALEDKNDVRLTRLNPATDYMEFYKRYMVSINGFYHQTDTDGINGVVVTDAMKTLRRSGQNQIGLFNFKAMGDLTFVPFTDDMIELANPKEARLHIPQDLTGKTCFLVLGGYFMTVDPLTFSRIGASSYLLDLANVPMKDRWMESSRYLDLRGMPVSATPMNPNEIHADDLYTPEFIRAYLKLSQSFLVILDCPEVFIQRQFIKRSRLPDMYTSYKEPKWPIVTGLGRQPEYWSVFEDRQWALTVYDNVVEQRIYNTVNSNGNQGIDDGNNPQDRGRIAMAHFLEIGRDI